MSGLDKKLYLQVDGSIPAYSLSNIVVFPSKTNVNVRDAFGVLNATVLSQLDSTTPGHSFVDMYIQNVKKSGRRRAKIQVVTSC